MSRIIQSSYQPLSLLVTNSSKISVNISMNTRTSLQVFRVKEVVHEELARVIGFREGRERQEAVGAPCHFIQSHFEWCWQGPDVLAPGHPPLIPIEPSSAPYIGDAAQGCLIGIRLAHGRRHIQSKVSNA